MKRPSPQTPPDDGFVSPDGGLDPRALTVAGGSVPFHSPVSADRGKHLSEALLALGSTPHDIVQLRVYAVDLSSEGVGSVMEVLGSFLDGAKPSLTGVGVSALASPDYLLEVEMVVQLASNE